MKSVYFINISLNSAIQMAAAQRANGKDFFRKNPLTQEAVIRLLIGAEGFFR